MLQERKPLSSLNPNTLISDSARSVSNSGNQFKNVTFTRLTLVKEQRRREKGLCFKCDEKFHKGHFYTNKKLFLIQGTMSDDEEEDEVIEEPKVEEA